MSEHEKRLARILGDITQVSGIKLNSKIDYDNHSIYGSVNGRNDLTITVGAMEQLDDDEIAVLIGHEAGHATRKHCLQKGAIITGTAESISAVWKNKQSGVVKKVLKTAAIIGATTVAESFVSRQWERTADRMGSELARKAGYDPAATATLFEKIDTEGSSGGRLLDSHPASSERVKTARQKYGDR